MSTTLLKSPIFRSLACAALLVSCGGVDGPGHIPASPYSPYKNKSGADTLEVGDTVELFVMEDQAYNGTFQIREKGDIILPKSGRIYIRGLSVEAAQSKIKATLQSDQLKSATIILDRTRHGEIRTFNEAPKLVVFITGKVVQPGQHMIALRSNDAVYAYEAVLIAGGVTPFADEKHSYILRRAGSGARQKIPLDLRSIRQGNASDIALVEGDMIYVPERRFGL